MTADKALISRLWTIHFTKKKKKKNGFAQNNQSDSLCHSYTRCKKMEVAIILVAMCSVVS